MSQKLLTDATELVAEQLQRAFGNNIPADAVRFAFGAVTEQIANGSVSAAWRLEMLAAIDAQIRAYHAHATGGDGVGA